MQGQGQYQKQSQQLKILPQQIQFLNLLQLNKLELEQHIQRALEENPFLEYQATNEVSLEESEKENSEGREVDYDDPNNWGGIDDDIADYRLKSEAGFDHSEVRQFQISDGETWRENLKSQVRLYPDLSDEKLTQIEFLIDSFEEDGRLDRSPEILADDLSFSEGLMVDEKDMLDALRIIQEMDPPGIGARSVQECLLLQLNRMRGSDAEEAQAILIAQEIVEKHLKDLAAHDYDDLMDSLSASKEEVRAAMDVITSLNPHPITKRDNVVFEETVAIFPDYQIELDGDEIIVSLPNGRTDAVRIGKDAVLLAKKTTDKKANQFLKQKMEDARWLIEALKQRDNTMMETMRIIATLQKEYFLSGDIKKLNPMILKDVADYIGMDVSTISRSTSGKYVQTPFGVVHVKDLFTQTFTTQDGKEVTTREVQDALLDIIEAEDKNAPYNDSQLQKVLKEKGFAIARRTVAKYRESLEIPVADQRRELV